MRIAFISGKLSRRACGVKVVVERLSAALIRQGHDVRVFGIEDAAWIAGDSSAWTGGPATVFPTCGPTAFGYAPKLAAAVRSFAPDVVHSHGIWMYGSVVSASLARAGVPNVISPHGMLDPWALAQSHRKKRIAGALFEWKHLAQARCIHTLNADESYAARNFGLRNPLAVLPNGVDLPDPCIHLTVPTWRAVLPEGARVLLYFGRLHRKKNLVSLIKAWTQVGRHPWHLVIAGPDHDDYRAELESVTANLNCTEKVIFIGAQFGAEKDATFAVADGFVLPSLSEGLPMAVLEAWAWRLPVLMSTHCNLPEGFAVGAALDSGTTTNEIDRALTAFMSYSRERHATIGDAGHALVESTYSWDELAKQFSALYESLLSDPTRVAPYFVTVEEPTRA